MKQKIAIFLTIVVVILGVFAIWYTTPKHYSRTINGVYYQLGTEGVIENIQVHIDGKLKKHLNGKRTFRGVVDFEGSKVPRIPKDREKLQLIYNGHNFTTIFSGFRVIDDKGRIASDMLTYGLAYVDDKFSEFTINVMGDDNQWNPTNGYRITAPAKNRQEAMKMSQELIDTFNEQSWK
ncbi:hypothetical protein GZH47_25315 [Paenibacillus rhizovicinus]|uniref:Uncharacterized protein n=1 Tax=Paenibacillus rhizovicinus TaxID=2704463 RepID=A0A6C0P5J7_9BACL|nr:hypothetical protein [Paenibacillus rhizovicinus]QHW33789.1 hypothetical protein GZH47_25315 [Paenibacillus rhizovicinus]